ncbi:hypothetical protein BDQ17DRAFT_682151 [Cyathus striatus]|nr:hypothetical protein BDQ17DRAFT_682151 [Cyathus striatus]
MTMNAPLDEPVDFHPQFNSPNANVVLKSTEGTYYRVPSFTLCNTCGYFRRLLIPHMQQLVPAHTIPIDSGDLAVERVLKMICGLENPRWSSFDELESALSLAAKWDATGPISFIRSAITSPTFTEEPLRLYALTTRYVWQEEAEYASELTLTLNLFDEKYKSQLEQLKARDLMALLRLHRQRRDIFSSRIHDMQTFSLGNAETAFCRHCGVHPVNNHTWRELKSRMFLEMDRRPLGDTIYGLDMEEWPESVACWESKCSKCDGLNYDKLVTLRRLKECIDELPSTI